MPRVPRLGSGVGASIIFLVTCTLLSYGQRGGGGGGSGAGGGGGGASTQRGASSSSASTRGSTTTTAPRGAAPAPRGARGSTNRGNDQQKKEQELLDPHNGMVVAYITVTDKDHLSIPGLKKENFKLTEDNVEQNIELFSVESGPLSVGFVLGGPPNESRTVPLEFLKATASPAANEFFLINDDNHPPGGTVIQAFTTDLVRATRTYPAGGVTSDSIYMGLDYLREAANKRKVLILIGGTLDGDTAIPGAGLSVAYVERFATKLEVQVYSILTSNDGGDVYDDGGTSYISPLTGGRNYLASPISFSLESTAKEIARGLGVQYAVAYRSTNPAPDGKWRKIRVSVSDVPETAGKINVWTKAGYYVEKEKKRK